MKTIRKPYILKTYGHHLNDVDYDYLFGFLRSRDKKTKDKLDIQQKTADLALSIQKRQMAVKQIEAEELKKQAEEARVFTAQKEAATAEAKLKGTNAMTTLTYVGLAIGGLVLIGGIGTMVYLLNKQNKTKLKPTKIVKAASAAPVR
jgi:hypothetical protein